MASYWGEAVQRSRNIERPRRVSLDLEAIMMIEGERVKITVLDISRTGLRLRLPEPVFAGETYELELGRSGFVGIEICWCQGCEAGAVFLDLK